MLEMQTNSEVLAAILAAICIASPTIEARLKELEPGRGRQAAAQQIQGATSVFAIGNDLSPEQRQVPSCAVFGTTCKQLARSAHGPQVACIVAM